MQIEGCTALVTGANRGLGKAYAAALLDAGAAKVYAGARDPATVDDPRLVPVKLDVTSSDDVAAAAARCNDVNLLINNAGIMLMSPMLADGADVAMRREMEVNVFGTQAMLRAFAPVLKANGGGTVVNMLSVVSWFVNGMNPTYCASKHAALAVSEAARIELKQQGTQVVAVYAGFIDTDMAAGVDQPKVTAQQVAEATLKGVRENTDHVHADRRAEEIWKLTRSNPGLLAAQMQSMYLARKR